MAIYTRRIYELLDNEPGYRILVDRIWPRGVKKDNLNLNEWLKELGPSHTLRKWFDHDITKWMEFKERYSLELANHVHTLERLRKLNRNNRILLLYSARDKLHNQAIVLKKVIEQ